MTEGQQRDQTIHGIRCRLRCARFPPGPPIAHVRRRVHLHLPRSTGENGLLWGRLQVACRKDLAYASCFTGPCMQLCWTGRAQTSMPKYH